MQELCKNIALGVDKVCFRMLGALPDSAWHSLGRLVDLIIESVVWPPQILVTLLALLPKKLVALAPSVSCRA